MRSLSVTLLLVALLVVIGCDAKKSTAPVKEGEVKKAEPAAPEPSFLYQFEPGKTVRYRTTTEMEMTGGMMAMKRNQIQELTWKVLEVDAEGLATVELSYDVIKLTMEHPMMGVVEFDSTAEGAADEAPNPLVALEAAFLGKKVTLKITPQGQIKEASGFDKIVEEMVKDNPMLEMMGGMINDETMKGQMQSFVAKMPDEDLKVGDEYKDQVSSPSPVGGSVTADITSRVKSIDEKDGRTIGTLESSATIDMSNLEMPEADPDDPMSAMLSQIKISDGKVTGVTTFDMTNGQLVSNRSVTTMTMDMMGQPSEVKTVQTTERIE